MTADRRLRIAPSILAGDFAALGETCRAAEAAGADWIHVDVMDGRFVPPITFGAQMVAALRPHVRGVLDVHLMVAPVEPQLDAFIAAGADVITVHAEAGPHLDRCLRAIRAAGRRAGAALNPATPPEALAYVMDAVDLICVMTVNPGYGGQSFLSSQLPKIAALRAMIGERPVHLQVDGGVSVETAGAVARAGADVLVAGAAFFRGGPDALAGNLRALLGAAA